MTEPTELKATPSPRCAPPVGAARMAGAQAPPAAPLAIGGLATRRTLPAADAPVDAPPDGAPLAMIRRAVVQSSWLKIVPPVKSLPVTAAEPDGEGTPAASSSSSAPSQPALSEAEKKRQELGEPTIYQSSEPNGVWTPVDDSTDAGYRQAADTEMGGSSILEILAVHEIIQAPLYKNTGHSFALAHLIAAEFGGQHKYDAIDNIRLHPRELEYGEWQKAENRVKRRGKRGYVTARSTEDDSAKADLVEALMERLLDLLAPDEAGAVRAALTVALKSVDYVADSVDFSYADIDDPSASFDSPEWNDLTDRLALRPDVTAQAIVTALLQAKVPLPARLTSAGKPAGVAIKDRADLIRYLAAQHPKDKDAKAYLASIENLVTVKASGSSLANNLKKWFRNEARPFEVTVDMSTLGGITPGELGVSSSTAKPAAASSSAPKKDKKETKEKETPDVDDV